MSYEDELARAQNEAWATSSCGGAEPVDAFDGGFRLGAVWQASWAAALGVPPKTEPPCAYCQKPMHWVEDARAAGFDPRWVCVSSQCEADAGSLWRNAEGWVMGSPRRDAQGWVTSKPERTPSERTGGGAHADPSAGTVRLGLSCVCGATLEVSGDNGTTTDLMHRFAERHDACREAWVQTQLAGALRDVTP